MFRILLSAFMLLALSIPAQAEVTPFPAAFRTQDIPVEGVTLHVRVGGKGPAVVLLHGFGDTGDMWAPLAADLAKDHTVVVPDLRGMGLSSIPDGGYDKKTQAGDIRARVGSAGHRTLGGHRPRHRHHGRLRLCRALSAADRPPGGDGCACARHSALGTTSSAHRCCGTSTSADRMPNAWSPGRERIYLDRFWNEFAGDPSKVDEATRQHYAKLYARPGAMHAAFAQFRSIRQDAVDNEASMADAADDAGAGRRRGKILWGE